MISCRGVLESTVNRSVTPQVHAGWTRNVAMEVTVKEDTHVKTAARLASIQPICLMRVPF